jgi:hypothetical protein
MRTTNPHGRLHTDSDHADPTRKSTTTTIRGRSSMLAATGPRSTHDGGSCGYGCGLGVDTDAEDAFGGRWSRLEAPTEHTQGPYRGHERQSDHEKEAKGAKNEALWLLRTFVGCSATAQWAAVGEAPAPQLTDRPRSPPQRGNGRERLPPPAAHGHMRPLHDLQPGSVAEAGARVQASIEGLEPVFSTCSDARSSTNCCRRWATSA